ncbi:MAG: hypothetical protein GY808_00055, partial [Gammaproteobacteria bacterium]|nr:hypothetical protein [Gammaproteobacteria bacterium]
VANTVPYQYAALSPDGKWGVYAANDTGAQDQARLVNLAHPEREIIIESGNSGHYIWSPDSSQVAYFRIEEEFDPFTPSATITVHLYSAIDEKGRILSQIDFFSKGYAAPSWSPNGEFIALFVSTGWLEKNNNPEIGLLSLILIDVQNGQHKRYDFPEIQSSPMWMRWSEDSRKIYFDGISEILEISFPE